MDNDVKICLPGFRLHSAVCFSTALLSKIFQPAACFKLQPLPRQGVGMVVRIEEKRREEKRREEKRREEKRREGSNQQFEIFEVGFFRNIFPP